MTFFLDGERRLRTVWRLSLFMLAFLIGQIAASLVLLVGYVLVLIVSQGDLNAEGLQHSLQEATLSPSGEMMFMSVDYTTRASVFLVVVFRLWLDRRSLGSLGLTAPPWRASGGWSWRRSWLIAFVLGSAPIAIGFAVVWLGDGYDVGSLVFSHEAAIFSAALVIAAFQEEIVCRGYLLQNMVDVGRPITGVLVSSLIFWLLHGLNPSAWDSWFVGANLFLAGVLLSLAYLVSRDLWFPTIMHFAWNFTQGIVFDIEVSGLDTPGVIDVATNPKSPQWLTGGSFGLEGSAVTTAIMAIMIVPLGFAVRRKWPSNELRVEIGEFEAHSPEII